MNRRLVARAPESATMDLIEITHPRIRGRRTPAVATAPAALGDPFRLPPLPWDSKALEPHFSADSIETHHGRHHAAYVTTLNEMLVGSRYARLPLEEIVARSRGKLCNMAAQHWNHSFFWHCLSPSGGGEPKSHLREAIDKTWGSLPEFRSAFETAALSVFGSGWAWLVLHDGDLSIMVTKDAANPLGDDARPLLALDMWEHAFYIDHRADKARYLAAFWNVVNWEFALGNYDRPYVQA
jgi:Fe-Mn family superoxide dismutase